MTEAQRLAERCEHIDELDFSQIEALGSRVANELRRLEAENARMRSELERPMSSEATVLVHDNARLRAEVQALHKSLADSVLHAKTGWERYESANHMRNQVLADIEALRGAVPAGLKLVPVEPTSDMWKAARAVPESCPPYPPHYGLIWDAMLAAAPQPAQGEKQ
jgi:hypothetical protein